MSVAGDRCHAATADVGCASIDVIDCITNIEVSMKTIRILYMLVAASALGQLGCQPVESHHRLQPMAVETQYEPYSGPKYRTVIGKFANKSPYMRGIFSDGKDRLGDQARQILKTHLSETNRFILMDRMNMDELARESGIAGSAQKLTGGQLVVTGAVTEFGRREVGSAALGGVLAGKRSQVAHAKVQLSLVDVTTSQIVGSVQGEGEYQLTNEHVLGFGSTAGYDGTMADKVLNLAMIEAVNALIRRLEEGEIKPIGDL